MRKDPEARMPEACCAVPKAVYSLEAIRITAHVFAERAEVLLEETSKSWRLTLRPAAASLDSSGRAALEGEFLNEVLNQEYRFLVGRFNQRISGLIVTQALFSARGGEAPPPPPQEPAEFKAEVEDLLSAARAEIGRTMPKKLPPQGAPVPPLGAPSA